MFARRDLAGAAKGLGGARVLGELGHCRIGERVMGQMGDEFGFECGRRSAGGNQAGEHLG